MACSVYGVRMARTNVTIPDAIIEAARARGLNVSAVATAALLHEVERLAKADQARAELDALDAELGPVDPDVTADAQRWAADLAGPVSDTAG